MNDICITYTRDIRKIWAAEESRKSSRFCAPGRSPEANRWASVRMDSMAHAFDVDDDALYTFLKGKILRFAFGVDNENATRLRRG